MLVSRGGKEFPELEIPELNLVIALSQLDASGSIELDLKPLRAQGEVKVTPATLTVDVSVKPFITLPFIES